MNVVGPYHLLSPIAAGGFGRVFLARRRNVEGFGRLFAMKCLHSHLEDGAALAMLIDEARLASRISHVNVLSVIDVVEHEGSLWLVMEYEEGESFARLLGGADAKAEPPSIGVVAAILAGTLHGLHAAHEVKGDDHHPLGLVHRDVSPHNILVTCHGVAKLHDFGIAKAAGRIALTEPGQVKGKLAYMAPEQIAGDEVDRRTDLYSVGIILWEAIAGRRLFDGATPVIPAFRRDGPVLAAELTATEPVRAVVARALRIAPEDRFETASAMAEALEAATALATEREVARWVTTTAKDALSARRALVEAELHAPPPAATPAEPQEQTMSAVEVGRPPVAPPSAAPLAAMAPERERSALALYVVAGIVGIGLAIAAVMVSQASGSRVSATARALRMVALPAPPTAPAAAPPPPPRTEPTVDPVPQASVASPRPVAAPARPLAPTVRSSASPRSCDPPYTINEKGLKIVKVECIQ